VVAADRSSGVERPGSGADVAVVLTLEDRGEGCAVDLDHQAFVPSWFVRSPRGSPPAGDPAPPPPPTTPRAQRRSTVTVASTSRRREVAPSGRAGGGGDLRGAGPARRHEGTKARRHEGPHVVAADRSSGVERPGSGADVAVVLTLEDRGEGCAVDLDHQAFVPSWFVRSPDGARGGREFRGGRGCRRGSRLRAFVPSCLRAFVVRPITAVVTSRWRPHPTPAADHPPSSAPLDRHRGVDVAQAGGRAVGPSWWGR
jgi:hypothetical protein